MLISGLGALCCDEKEEGHGDVKRKADGEEDAYPEGFEAYKENPHEANTEEGLKRGEEIAIMGAIPIGDRGVEPPVTYGPEVDMGIIMVDREVCYQMGKCGQAKEGRQALPAGAGVFRRGE